MTLLSDDTLWIFLSASIINKNDAHIINNFVKGIKSLECNNIKSCNIALFIDKDDSSNTLLKQLHSQLDISYKVLPLHSLINVIEKSNHKNVVVFVTGHGDKNGIDGYTPKEFINVLTNGNSNKNLIIYFGQCHSYNAFHKITSNLPNFIMVGVNKEKSPAYILPNEKHKYTIFLYWLFEWISNLKNMDDRSIYASVDFAADRTTKSNIKAEEDNKAYLHALEIKKQTMDSNNPEYKILIADIEDTKKDCEIDKVDIWYNKGGKKLARCLKY